MFADRFKVNLMASDRDPQPCASPRNAGHTHTPVWCCPRINCTLLSWDDIQAMKRRQGQQGLEGKVSVAHKTKRHLRFNKINKCCWKDLLRLSHRGGEGRQLNSLGFAVTRVESSRKACKKLQESSLENICIFHGYFSWAFTERTSHSFSPSQLFAVHVSGVCLVGTVVSEVCSGSYISSHLIYRKLTLDSSGTISTKKKCDGLGNGKLRKTIHPFSRLCVNTWVSGIHEKTWHSNAYRPFCRWAKAVFSFYNNCRFQDTPCFLFHVLKFGFKCLITRRSQGCWVIPGKAIC